MSKKTLINLFLVIAVLLILGVNAASAVPPAQEELTYTVKLGDNLWTLAEKYLGSGAAYWAIVAATNAKHEEDTSFAYIENPDLIHPGWKLLIPSAEEAAEYVTPTPTSPCGKSVIASVDPRELESAPPPVIAVEDERGGFILDHPLFSENFDVVYESNEVIPPALDIVAVEITRDGDDYCFHIRTAGENLPELLQAERRSTRFGVYVDRDLNGASDVLLSTTIQPERGVVITPDFEVIGDMPHLSVEGNLVTMCVSQDEVGDHFDWVVSSGYSPHEEAYYQTPIETVFVVPQVDFVYPNPARTVLVHMPLSGSGQSCQVTGMGVTTCPPPGTPPNNPPGRTTVPGSSCQGWMYQRTQCGNLGYEWWCNCSSIQNNQWHFGLYGKRVFKGSTSGWVAKCPFWGGINNQQPHDSNQDGVPDRIVHTVTDGNPIIPGTDDDGDGKLDVMIFDYHYSTNQVTICNVERDYQTNVQVDERCNPPTQPYADPMAVPGRIP